MKSKKLPFVITNAMIDRVAGIAELVGRLSASQLSGNPTLRRVNRIRTIHGSLAIEQNTLPVEPRLRLASGGVRYPRPSGGILRCHQRIQ